MSETHINGENLKGIPSNAYKELKQGEEYVPVMPPSKAVPEVTPYSVIMGVLMAIVFSAAAAYLGLKIGQVFEAAIPIAIIAVGFSNLLERKNALGENVIIQSIGQNSGLIVAGAIFTIPALYILNLNAEFYKIFLASLFGGVLGILFLIPFRKFFVSDMHGKYPFPEATATTEVLVAGEKGGKQALVLVVSGIIGGFNDFLIEEIIPSEKIFFYRNKMEYSFSDKRWLTQTEINSGTEVNKDFALGLHVPGVFDKVLDIDECFLQSELSNKILNFTKVFFKNKKIPAYSTNTHSGFLRNLVIKTSHHTSDLMVNIVTFSEDDVLLGNYSEALLNKVPQVTTIVNNINQKKSSVATGDYEKVIYGSGYIFDSIGNYKFRISANSFFQTNTLQAEKLYQTALDFAELSGKEIVYDLYSGAGTISIFVSGKAKEVYAFETVESAISDADENKKINNTNNVHFFTADLYKSFRPIVEESSLPSPEVIILDPPRSGMHANTVEDVVLLKPKKIVYVSCNPATQVRDIKLFANSGFKLIKIRPVDMFPHTFHIENIAILGRK